MAALKCMFLQTRNISTTNSCFGKRNFRKFMLYGKRGSRMFKKEQAEKMEPDFKVGRGVRDVGYVVADKFITVPEMIPDLIVPDLKDFALKPYVTYKAPEVVQSEFTARDLFDAVYSKKIVEDFKKGKLDVDGNPVEPSPEETLEPGEAVLRARKSGSDIFGP